MNKTNAYFIPARQNGKTERERKVIFEITGDGLTAEEFRKILQEATAEIEAKFGPEEDEAEQEQEAAEQEQEATEQEQGNTEKEPPEVTAESILEAAEETTCRR